MDYRSKPVPSREQSYDEVSTRKAPTATYIRGDENTSVVADSDRALGYRNQQAATAVGEKGGSLRRSKPRRSRRTDTLGLDDEKVDELVNILEESIQRLCGRCSTSGAELER